MNDPPQPQKIRESLDVSWKEGIPASVMLGIMDNYLIPLGLFLGAGAQEIGFLASVPHLAASLCQLSAVRAVRFVGSRLRFLIAGTVLQAILLLPLAGLAIFPFRGRVGVLIALTAGFRILGSLIAAAWGSLVSDYLPPHERGRYFGWRSQVVGMAGMLGVGLGGALLYFMQYVSQALGFFLLFFLAALSRFVSFLLMRRMVDLAGRSTPESDFTFFMFLRRFGESNFVKYALYVASVAFATNLASPYFSVYMLRDLRMGYLNYMVVTLAAVVTGLLSFPIWGRHADMVGNAKILKMTSFLIPLIPLPWVFSGGNLWGLIAVQIFAGFVWGGFNLCATNFIYDAVRPEKRVRCLGYFNLIHGISIFAGASLGGFLADRLPPFRGYSFHTLFLLSALLRLAAHFFLSRHFREVRATTKPVSSTDLFFSVVGVRPLVGRTQELELLPSSKQPS